MLILGNTHMPGKYPVYFDESIILPTFVAEII